VVAGLNHKNDEHKIAHMNIGFGDGNCHEVDRVTSPLFAFSGSRYKSLTGYTMR
jgi:hypothetical protein